jgi:hypothetical protein
MREGYGQKKTNNVHYKYVRTLTVVNLQEFDQRA